MNKPVEESMPDSTPIEAFDKLSQDYITALYQGFSGFISYQPGEKEAGVKEKIYFTYGEILYPSVNRVIEYMQVTEEDVFYDLGSGIGKVPLHFFLKTPVKKAFGIEASIKRNDVAHKVYRQVQSEFPELFRENRILGSAEKNFLEVDIRDATIIYTCSTCFSEELLADIAAMLDQCPKLRCVVSLKELPLKVLAFDKIIEIECTWDKTKCYAYHLK